MDVENLASELISYQQDVIFTQNNQINLRKSFLNRFIAVKTGKIIDEGNSIDEIKDKLEKKGIDPGKTVIEFIPEEAALMIL